jgi:MFS family permease
VSTPAPPSRGRWRRIAVDTTALRESRDFRLLATGEFLTGLGTQMSLVAVPYQLFVVTRSAFLTGLLGAVELVPLVAMSLLGGALADRVDRRLLLLGCQSALVLTAAALALGAFLGPPPIALLYVLAGLLAGFGAVENVSRTAMIPAMVGRSRLRSALSFNFGLTQLTMVVGPGIGGVVIATLGVGGAYAIDAGSCLAMVAAAAALSPQRPIATERHEPIRRSIGEGLRFVRGNRALMGSFAIDLVAMTFGMPRVLFAVLALTVYDAGATGTGVLYAAVAAGATIAALTTGWLEHARYLGRIVIAAVSVWGLAIAGAGAMTSLWPAAGLLLVAGAADSVSAVCRLTINQTVTPEEMRGRMSSVFSLVVTSGPRLGDIESGTVASLTSARASVASGGLACLAGVVAILFAFPALAAYDGDAVAAGPS